MSVLEYNGYVLEKSDKYYKKLDKVNEWNKKSKSWLKRNTIGRIKDYQAKKYLSKIKKYNFKKLEKLFGRTGQMESNNFYLKKFIKGKKIQLFNL